jgi:hypothetical protein
MVFNVNSKQDECPAYNDLHTARFPFLITEGYETLLSDIPSSGGSTTSPHALIIALLRPNVILEI